jgi:hypothetical protein
MMLEYQFMFYPRREKTLKVCKKRVLRKMCRAERKKVKWDGTAERRIFKIIFLHQIILV